MTAQQKTDAARAHAAALASEAKAKKKTEAYAKAQHLADLAHAERNFQRVQDAARDLLAGALVFVEYEKAVTLGNDLAGMVLYADASKKLHAAIEKATGEKP